VSGPSSDPGQASALSSGDADQFGRWLSAHGRDYLVITRSGDQRVQVRFCGPFQGRPVVWDCDFITLAAESGRCRENGAAVGSLRNFIEVGAPAAHGVPVRVGLSLARIDTPAIEKMIVMIRNYKRLRPGRHEYGEPQAGLSREA
jgi:hypothetical protein